MRRLAFLLAGMALLLATVSVAGTTTTQTLDKDLEPVVVTGQQLPSFGGVSLNRLFLYAFDGVAWHQIPWQFDEVAGSEIVAHENGLLDTDDQLVFMAADAGDQAPEESWIADADSRTYPRYEITVTDPLAPSKQGWVYLYRSGTLDYDDEVQPLVTAEEYLLGLMENHPGTDLLKLHGSDEDILDRTKIRAEVQFAGTKTENDLEIDLRSYPTVTSGRFSMDLSPQASGSTYYDGNTPGGVTVDGSPDSVTASPAANWGQVSGETGTVVQVSDYTEAGGTPSTYYKDNDSTDPNDTGDKLSYGDAGVKIQSPNRHFTVRSWTYVLPPSQPNVGATYQTYAMHPLEAEAREQSFAAAPTPTATSTGTPTPTRTQTPTSPAAEQRIFLPLVVRTHSAN